MRVQGQRNAVGSKIEKPQSETRCRYGRVMSFNHAGLPAHLARRAIVPIVDGDVQLVLNNSG
jgi:hypothetical protein